MKSGKDTIGRIIQYLTSDYVNKCDFETYLTYIIDFPEWKIKKFAGKLKEIVSILTGIPVRDLEKQEVKDSRLPECWHKFDDNNHYVEPDNVRELLQTLGTDLLRNQLHPNVFVNALFADYKHKLTGKYYNDQKGEILELPNWIITDCRFKNELQAIKDRNGITIRVNRLNSTNQDGHTYINKKDRTHPSETALDDATFDYIIDNNGTIEELVIKVKEILIKEKIL